MIKAFLINPNDKSITPIDVTNKFAGPNGMYKAIGCDTIEHGGYLNDNKDVLLVDEDARLKKGLPKMFAIHDYVFYGKALIVGFERNKYIDPLMKIVDIAKLVRFL